MKKRLISFLILIAATCHGAGWSGLPITTNEDWYLSNAIYHYPSQIWAAGIERSRLFITSTDDIGYVVQTIPYFVGYTSGVQVLTNSLPYLTNTLFPCWTNAYLTNTDIAPLTNTVTIGSNIVSAPMTIARDLDYAVEFSLNSWVEKSFSTNGTDLNAWFSTADTNGDYPQYLPEFVPLNQFYYSLGSSNAWGYTTNSFGLIVDGQGGFSRDATLRSFLLAQSAFDTNFTNNASWNFQSIESLTTYEDNYGSCQIKSYPVLIHTCTGTPTALSVTISGTTNYASLSKTVSVTTTNILTDQWDSINNLTASSGMSGDGLILEYTNGIKFYDVFGNGGGAELNATAINQRRQFLNHEVWLSADPDWSWEHVDYEWSGGSTNSMAQAISACEASAPVVSTNHSGSIPFTYALNSVGGSGSSHSYSALARSRVHTLTVDLPATNYWTNLTFNADWYIEITTNLASIYAEIPGSAVQSFNNFGNAAIKNLPNQYYTTADLQTVQVNVTTNALLTCSVSFGSTTCPTVWATIPATNGASGVVGWSAPDWGDTGYGYPLCLFRFDRAGGLQYY